MTRWSEQHGHQTAWPWAALILLLPLSAPLLPVLRLLDSGICAQLPTHMLAPGGVTLPLCARNTGIYTGAALTFGIIAARHKQRAMAPPPPLMIVLLLALIAVMGLDGVNSVATDLRLPHPYAPSNALRLITGSGAGVALALLFSPVVARARFGAQDQRPPLLRLQDLVPYAAAVAVADVVIWSRASWTLLPIALLSNAGLLGVLAGVNWVALRNVGRQSGASAAWSVSVPTAASVPLLLGVLELAALAAIRLLLTGPGSAMQ